MNGKDMSEEEVKLTDVAQEKPVYSAFSQTRKLIIISVITLAGFLGPMSGNIYIPILPELQKVFGVSETAINGTVSVFMVVFAFAPLFWSSWADFGGRKTWYLVSITIFVFANIMLAVLPPHIASLYCFRMLQAFGASSVVSLGVGTIADIVEPTSRAKVISYFMLGPQLGPVIGPVLSLIGTQSSWRWVFGFLAIFGGFVLLLLNLIPETLRYLVGNGEYYQDKTWILFPKPITKKVTDGNYPITPKPSIKAIFKMMTFKPVLSCSLISGLIFASFYGLIISYGRILKKNYQYSNMAVSIAYLCPGLSLITGSLISGHLSDYLRFKRQKAHGKTIPEERLSTMVFGLILTTISTTAYGWICQYSINKIALFVFTFLTGFGTTWVFVISTTYLSESCCGRPATTVAIGNIMRNLAAAISSAIIEILINSMGYGWCFTGLGIVNMISLVLSIIVTKYGAKWRQEYEDNDKTNEK